MIEITLQLDYSNPPYKGAYDANTVAIIELQIKNAVNMLNISRTGLPAIAVCIQGTPENPIVLIDKKDDAVRKQIDAIICTWLKQN